MTISKDKSGKIPPIISNKLDISLLQNRWHKYVENRLTFVIKNLMASVGLFTPNNLPMICQQFANDFSFGHYMPEFMGRYE